MNGYVQSKALAIRFLSALPAILLLGTGPQAFGKSVWLAAIGIHEDNPAQNYRVFYAEAKAFQDVCARSKASPKCHLFMNKDPELSVNPDLVRELGITGNPKPLKSTELLKRFEEELTAARPGDTVFLSMTDHGSPSHRGQSCIFLGTNDYICETDLEPILKKKKPGVKVAINASGCFSGAFVDLAGPEVCVAVGADRRKFGILKSGEGFWTNIKRDKVSTLGALRTTSIASAAPLLASESMTSVLCSRFRAAFPDFDTPVFDFSKLDASQACRNDWSGAGAGLKAALEQLDLASAQVEKAKLCQSTTADNAKICSALKRVSSPEFKQELQGLIGLSKDAQAIQTELNSIEPDSALPAPLYLAIVEASQTDFADSARSFARFNSQERKALEEESQRLIRSKAKIREKLERMRSDYTKRLKTLQSNARQSLDLLTACFFPIELIVLPREAQYLKDYDRYPAEFPREFTEKDIEEARSCEDSIRLQ